MAKATTELTSDQSRALAQLNEFLAIPSISALPAHAEDCRRAAEWLRSHLAGLGCRNVALLEGKGHPVVWAESPEVPGKPTVLIYGHYDVQPVDPIEEWQTPPFQPSIRGGNLFARGSADDKGQVFALIKAYEASLDAGGRPPCNVRFIIEGEEECGGQVIFDLLEKEPDRAKVDAVLVSDMSYYARGIPAVYTALRGMCYAEIQVKTLERDLHSGTYGGVAPNAIETLVRILSDLKGPDGKINISKLYKSVIPPTREELKGWKSLPFDSNEFRSQEVTSRALTGLKGYSVMERTWALPTFEIHGIRGGFVGDGAKTVIPAQATAKVSMRLVPGLPMAKAAKLLERAVRKVAPKWADVKVTILHGGDPVQVATEGPPFQSLDQAFREVVGRGAVLVRAGGSIPVVPKLGIAGAPVILTGIGLPDDGLHSPNEKLALSQFWDGIAVYRRFLELFGQSRCC